MLCHLHCSCLTCLPSPLLGHPVASLSSRAPRRSIAPRPSSLQSTRFLFLFFWGAVSPLQFLQTNLAAPNRLVVAKLTLRSTTHAHGTTVPQSNFSTTGFFPVSRMFAKFMLDTATAVLPSGHGYGPWVRPLAPLTVLGEDLRRIRDALDLDVLVQHVGDHPGAVWL